MKDELTLAASTGLPFLSLVFHVGVGVAALVSGFIAIAARKGGKWHRRSGLVFVVSMIATGLTAAGISVYEGKSPGGGLVTAYFVFTAWTTIRPLPRGGRRVDIALMLFAFIFAALGYLGAFTALGKPGNRLDGVPAGMLFFMSSVNLLAATGDLKMILAGGIQGTRRIARHLWRMCFGLFIATGSFVAQLFTMKYVPDALRSLPVILVLSAGPLVVLLYWMWRIRLKQNIRGLMTLNPIEARGPAKAVSLLLGLTTIALASPAAAQSIDRAKIFFDRTSYAEAKAELLAVQKADDRNPAAQYYLGRIAIIENEAEEAIRHFERAVELDERNALYHAWLGNAIREVTPRASKIRKALNAKRMKKEWEWAVALDPNQIDARYGLVQVYSWSPAFMGGSVEKAREQAEEIGKRNSMRGAIARGLIAEIGKNTAAEEAAYREAIVAAPDSAAGYFALGAMYARESKAAQAFQTLDEYVKRRPDDRRSLYEAGRIAGTTAQELDRGESALKQFLTTPPRDIAVTTIAGAHYWLGKIAEKRGARDAAREHYRSALKINQHNQLARLALDALE